MSDELRFRRRLRVAGGLSSLGLAVEMATLVKTSPASLLAFGLLGASLVCLGALVALVALVRYPSEEPPPEEPPTSDGG